MSPKVIIAIIILAAAGGGIYVVTQSSTNDTSAVVETVSTEVQSEDQIEVTPEDFNEKGFGALASLLVRGRSIMCDFSHVDAENNVESTGQFYYDGGSERFRVDSTTKTETGTYISHMVNDTELAYVWSEGPEGSFAMKMDVTATSEDGAPFNQPDSEQQSVSVDEEVDYTCRSWRVQSDLLVPPSDIEFMDMQAMMQEAMQNLPEGFTMPEGF